MSVFLKKNPLLHDGTVRQNSATGIANCIPRQRGRAAIRAGTHDWLVSQSWFNACVRRPTKPLIEEVFGAEFILRKKLRYHELILEPE